MKGKIIADNSNFLEKTDLVMGTFKFQKDDWRSKTVQIFRNEDKVLCPVKAWVKTVYMITQEIPNSNPDSVVCKFRDGNDTIILPWNLVQSKFRSVVDLMGEDELCLKKDDICLHSIGLGDTMVIFLSGVY